MRVCLLKPSNSGILGLEMLTLTEPLGLECVAGALESDGHECRIIDLRIDSFDKGFTKILNFNPHLFGVQCNFTTERFRTIDLARRLKASFPDLPVVVGGHDASRDPEWFSCSEIDVVVIGDGEEVISNLVDTYESGGDLRSVPGLMLNTKNGPVYTRPAERRREVDTLPYPARHLIKEYSNEYYMSFRRPLALLETARGCPYKCNFCSVWKFHGGTFREKSVDRVVSELKQIDAPNVFITDDIFWVNQKRSQELARVIQAEDIDKHFFMQTRTDIVTRFPHLIEQWKGCGSLTLFLGLEKVDDEGLQSVNKGNTAATNDRAIELLQELGVGYSANFIIDPAWDREDFARLRRWLDRTGAYNSGFSVLTPLPGTDLWHEAQQNLTTHNWELFDLEHAVLPTKLPLDEFYQEYSGLWKHALDIRAREQGVLRSRLKMLAGLATRKVTLAALKKGMLVGEVLSRPSTFLAAHKEVGDNADRTISPAYN